VAGDFAIIEQTGVDLSKYFDQYLRGTKIPSLEYSIEGKTLKYHFEDCVEGFTIPIKTLINEKEVWLKPTEKPQTHEHESDIESFEVDRNFYINSKNTK